MATFFHDGKVTSMYESLIKTISKVKELFTLTKYDFNCIIKSTVIRIAPKKFRTGFLIIHLFTKK